jgi:hypothetical protein
MEADKMSEQPAEPPIHPFAQVALCSGAASVLIAFLCMVLLRSITDTGMWACAAMVFAPALMGIGVAYFMSKQPK